MPPLGPTGWVLKQVDSWYVRRVAGRRDVDVRVHEGWCTADEEGGEDQPEAVRAFSINVRNNSALG